MLSEPARTFVQGVKAYAAAHPTLTPIAEAIGIFLLSLLVKKPIEDWWKERGESKRARRELYLFLADIYLSVANFVHGVNRFNDAVGTDAQYGFGAITNLANVFSETVFIQKYEGVKKQIESATGIRPREREGFQHVLQLVRGLPTSGVEDENRLTELASFCEEFSNLLSNPAPVGSFDRKKLQSAVDERLKVNVGLLVDRAISKIERVRKRLSDRHGNTN